MKNILIVAPPALDGSSVYVLDASFTPQHMRELSSTCEAICKQPFPDLWEHVRAGVRLRAHSTQAEYPVR